MPTMLTSATSSRLAHKNILLDTNVLIDAYKAPVPFQVLFEDIRSTPCALTMSWPVRFELFRTEYEPSYRDRLMKFVESLDIFMLPAGIEKDFYADALAIANVYAKKKIRAPSFVDCMIAACLKRHRQDLFLLTRNHPDFPMFLFDRIATVAIDTTDDVLALGLYEYSLEKAAECGL